MPDEVKYLFDIGGAMSYAMVWPDGNPADLVAFASKGREAFSGLLPAIVRSEKVRPGVIKINAASSGLKTADLEIKSK